MKYLKLKGKKVPTSLGVINVLKCCCIISLTVAVIISTGTFSFATGISDTTNRINAEKTANIVENHIDTDEIGEVIDTGNYYVDNSGDVTTTIPKESDDYITMEDDEGTKIGMSLPKELTAKKGIVTENGTVVYQTNQDVDMCVQSISGKQNGIPLDGFRELITIKSKDAPREYTFKFNMSKGYRLITSEEYCSEHNNKADEEKLLVEPGVVYIVDDHDRIQTVIDEPWATDANGAKIETRFTIDGPSLIQHVDFANDSVFPIIADPNPHPNKTRTLYLTKNQVRKWRNKSENSFAGQSVEYVVSGLIGIANTPAGLASGAIFLVGNQYLSIKKHKTWVKIYDNFKKDYARVKLEMKWKGKNAGYVYSGYIVEVAYVKKK